MASDSRALTLKLLADVADYQKKLNQSEKTTDGFSGKVQEFGKKAAVAFAAAGAAAAAYAGKLLVDGVKAAIADEAAQTKLATALRNATKATEAQIASTEDYITKTSIAFGVTDDDLRPSLQRLAIATNDVTKAQNLQKLALDISAGSGKSLEAVSNALARAYEGNTSSLGRLGIGLSAAELKSMSFDQVTQNLSNTFKNQASIQADTFQGKLTRLQIGFDEAKEAVGARLIPILTSLLTTFTDKVIPAAQSVIDKFKPFTKAIADNKDEFKALWDFVNKFIVPILTGALKTAFSGIVTALTAVVTAVGKVVSFFESMYNAYKKFVDFIKNNPLSKFLGKLNPFDNASFSTSASSGTGAFVQAGFSFDGEDGAAGGNAGGAIGGDTSLSGVGTGIGTDSARTTTVANPPRVIEIRGRRILTPQGLTEEEAYAYAERVVTAAERSDELEANTAAIRARIQARRNGTSSDSSANNVTINIGVAGDPEGTARAIRDVMADSFNRGTGGLVGAF
jgi:hypothetical protein